MKPKGQATKWIVGALIIGGAVIVMSLLNLGDNIVYFYTPDEAQAKALDLDGQTIRVGAMVKEGTQKWEPEGLKLSFVMTDFNGHEIAVNHTGSPPDMFKEGQGVVVEGKLSKDGTAMKSHKLMVKHSEEYREPDDPTKIDHELLQKSIFKEQNQ